MAAWAKKHGKDDSKDPYSKQNYKFIINDKAS